MEDKLIETIYENAQEGHPYQLYTLTKAQVVGLIDRLRAAEKKAEEAWQDGYCAGVNTGSVQG